jgi:hypothetical protein
MKTMTVKELKAILENANDEQNVVIDDVNDMCIAIAGGGENSADGIRLHTQQEFPAEWFDGEGNEIDWALQGIEKVTTPEEDEIYLIDDEKTGGREVYAKATFYDGFAEGAWFKLTYPKMSELTSELFQQIDAYCGGRCTDSGCITPQDVCLCCGKLVKFGIMDETNGHDKDLVRDINIRWVEDREMFRPILRAMYERDAQEIFKCKEFGWDDDIESVKECMQKYWDLHAETYLKYVADDQDLEAIIKFVRYDRSENA